MSSQQSKKCVASTQTSLDYPSNSEYSLTYPSKGSIVSLATAAIRVFTDGLVLPPLRKRIKYDINYLIAVKAAESQRKRQTRKLSESSEQSSDSWFRISKKKTKSKQKTESTEDHQSSSNESAEQRPPTRKLFRPRQNKEEDIKLEPADYEEITEARDGGKVASLTNELSIKVEDIKFEPTEENTAELKEEEINENLNEENAVTPQLINTKKPGKILAIKNIVFQVKLPKILEKMSEEKALIIGKLLSEFKRHNMETRQQTSDEFFQNVKIIKSKLKQILRSDDQSLSETYAPRRNYYYL